ncbi:hypothetical protein RFI_26539 [Reticulomyxa filosa]|uniref:Uncharacterized protein n=1 Tax=Reticulomyxa filosa TaxID=46433 RepID=X6MA08_RETFI|nr:hypothetical protein RFI_26539 [Reticulomyxa filosa]|eukprot:ETO10838.1 hypothetical protein RFI_26539 [Reticulomyxa filosa]
MHVVIGWSGNRLLVANECKDKNNTNIKKVLYVMALTNEETFEAMSSICNGKRCSIDPIADILENRCSLIDEKYQLIQYLNEQKYDRSNLEEKKIENCENNQIDNAQYVDDSRSNITGNNWTNISKTWTDMQIDVTKLLAQIQFVLFIISSFYRSIQNCTSKLSPTCNSPIFWTDPNTYSKEKKESPTKRIKIRIFKKTSNINIWHKKILFVLANLNFHLQGRVSESKVIILP